MTPGEITKRVKAVRANVGDYEAAHSLEDQLHQDVLRAIASGARNAAVLARMALETCELDFPRYTA